MEFKSFGVIVNSLERRYIEVVASIIPPKLTTYHSRIFEGDMDSEAELTLSFDDLCAFGQCDILRRLCSMLSISNLEFLSISAPDAAQSVNWYELFQHCKRVTTIQARGGGTNGLMRSLAPPDSTSVTSRSGGKRVRSANRLAQTQATNDVAGAHAPATPFTELTTLLLESLDFGADLLHGGVLYDVLADTLRRRKEDNTTLKTLRVDSCVISTQRVSCLKGHVRELRWDGEEGGSYHDEWDDHVFSSDFTETDVEAEDLFPGTAQTGWDASDYPDGW